jgi:hypothetical protein
MPHSLEVMKGSQINVVGWWYLVGGPSPGPLRLACLERRKNFGRYRAALEFLNKAAKWGMDDFFEELEMRVSKGIAPELVPLCRIAGMNKTRALHLYDLGVRGPENFGSIVGKLDEEIDDDFAEAIRRIARRYSAPGD